MRRGRRGARERPYRGTGKSWALDVQPAGGVTAAAVGAFLGEASEVDPTEVRWVRRALRLPADDMHALWSELENVVNRYIERERPDGQPCALFAALYPRTPAANAEP